jgi:predicted nucleotidyltransferase
LRAAKNNLINKRPGEATASRVRQRVNVSDSQLADFCRKYSIKSLSLFGSVLREDFRPDSDVDVLIEFQPGRTPGLLKLASMERELSILFTNRNVDLRTPQDLSHYFRGRIMSEAVMLCR